LKSIKKEKSGNEKGSTILHVKREKKIEKKKKSCNPKEPF